MEYRYQRLYLLQSSQRIHWRSSACRKVRWAFLLSALLLVAAPSFCANAPRPAKVLLLYIGDKDAPALTQLESGIRASMERGLNAPVWIYNEGFDEGWLGHDPRYAQTMEKFLNDKYGKRGIDIVVTVGNYALQYMQSRRNTLLPDAKLMYVCWQSPQPSVPNSAGAIQTLDLAPTLEVALTQNPGTHHILLIAGATASDRGMAQLFLSSGQQYLQEKHKEKEVDIQMLSPGTLDQTLSTLATLPKDTITIFTSYYGDSAGQGFVPVRMIPVFSAISNRPMYGWADPFLGRGIVGGSLMKVEATGEALGDLALRVVHGENPGEIPELRVDIRQNEFDWKQLKRWGIGMDKVPADSVVINREYTFWELYKWRIIGLLCLIVIEAVLIVVLIRLSVAQRRNLKQLAYQRAFEALIAQVAASFITVRGELVNPDIERSLQRAMEFFDLDRISLFEFSAETARLHLLCSYTSPGAEKPPAVVDLRHDLWATSQIWGGAPIIASHLDQLPDHIMTEILRDSGVCSLAAFPLQRKGDTFAILAFSTIRHEREWPPDVVEALQTVAHIFANTLERVQAEKVLTESQNQLTGIVESAMDAIIAIDGQQRVVVFNPAAEKIFGCTAEKAIGQSIEHFIPHRFRTQHAKNISGFAETGVTNRSMGALGALSALRANGEEFSIEASISQVWREGSRFFTVVIRDITERVRAEEQLRKSNQLNASILESLRNHVAVLDPKGIIVAATKREPGFVGSSGIDLLDLRVGENYFELCRAAAADDSDVAAALAGVQAIYDKRRDYFEMEYEYKSGIDRRWALLSMTSLKADYGGIVISHQDITEQKRHQQAIQDLSGRLISAQEQERSRIARELHDDISQQVAILAIEVQQLEKRFPEDSPEDRQMVQGLWKKTHVLSTAIQQLSHQLHSAKLEHLGISAALRGLCDEFSKQHKIEADFQFRQVPPRMDPDISLSLFRVAQESLHNVAKHSHARKVRLELIGTGGKVVLRVSDDGVGFDPDAHENRTGLGMTSMNERIRAVGGTLSVVSKPSLGTQVEAAIPLSRIVVAVDRASRSVPSAQKTG